MEGSIMKQCSVCETVTDDGTTVLGSTEKWVCYDCLERDNKEINETGSYENYLKPLKERK